MTNPFVLEGPIDPKACTDGRDIVKAKTALQSLGFFDPSSRTGGEITPLTEQGLFDGIKEFQQGHGLKPDGVMRPGGETARALRTELSDVGNGTEPKLERLVGTKGANKAVDLGNVRDRLLATGHLKNRDSGFGAALTDAIRAFQPIWGSNRTARSHPATKRKNCWRTERRNPNKNPSCKRLSNPTIPKNELLRFQAERIMDQRRRQRAGISNRMKIRVKASKMLKLDCEQWKKSSNGKNKS